MTSSFGQGSDAQGHQPTHQGLGRQLQKDDPLPASARAHPRTSNSRPGALFAGPICWVSGARKDGTKSIYRRDPKKHKSQAGILFAFAIHFSIFGGNPGLVQGDTNPTLHTKAPVLANFHFHVSRSLSETKSGSGSDRLASLFFAASPHQRDFQTGNGALQPSFVFQTFHSPFLIASDCFLLAPSSGRSGLIQFGLP